MIGVRKINPMVRAIATMGAIAALVGGITFAAQTSNVVALTDNTLASATATLGISSTQPDATCTATAGTTATGMNFTSLVPGTPSAAFDFCLDNTGTAPLDISVSSPTNFTTSTIPPSQISLHFSCATGGSLTTTLDTLASTTAFTGGPITAGVNDPCTVTATLNSAFSGSGGSVTPFVLNFVGTTPAPAV